MDFLLSHLRDRSPNENRGVLQQRHGRRKAGPRRGGAQRGRIPTKKPDGSLEWAPLLPAETINESIIARATAKNPQGAKKLQELEQIRELHASVASIAEATVREVLEE